MPAGNLFLMKAKREIEKLRQDIRRYEYQYYVLDQPEISDKEYDDLLKRLEALEAKYPQWAALDSPTRRVGGEPVPGFATVRHRRKMYSLDNAYTFDEILEWRQRVAKALGTETKVEFLAELKIDGVSVNLTYENGALVIGALRGDGQIGEDGHRISRRSAPSRLSSWAAQNRSSKSAGRRLCPARISWR
jgi:DNA ligase (NAD+)